MKQTLVLCFIHGFKGGESTFGDEDGFKEHLRGLVAQKLPKINVRVLEYPKYETRGDLGQCVSRIREWLQDKIIDMEVAAGTASPTVEPSVRTVLIGHSMGGIVAAEMVIGLASEKPIYTEDGVKKSESPTFNSLMFPYVQGVLSFDTPYLGISPGVVAHNAEGHYENYQTASAAISQLSGLGSTLLRRSKSVGATPTTTTQALSAASSARSSSPWAKWGKLAMYAGAAGAAAAGGAAAWAKRDEITSGVTWATSHLEFVGCLARGEELKKRVRYMVQLHDEIGVGFANLYTRLGSNAPLRRISVVGTVLGTVLGHDRTFCNLPKEMPAGKWREAVNNKAGDEMSAHMGMFEPNENPGYDQLSEDAAGFIVQWVDHDWYESSSVEASPETEEESQRPREVSQEGRETSHKADEVSQETGEASQKTEEASQKAEKSSQKTGEATA